MYVCMYVCIYVLLYIYKIKRVLGVLAAESGGVHCCFTRLQHRQESIQSRVTVCFPVQRRAVAPDNQQVIGLGWPLVVGVMSYMPCHILSSYGSVEARYNVPEEDSGSGFSARTDLQYPLKNCRLF